MNNRNKLLVVAVIVALSVTITLFRLALQVQNGSDKSEVAGEKIVQTVAPVAVEEINEAIDCSCEQKFVTPLEIAVEGKVLANFVGGLDFGLVSEQIQLDKTKFYVIDDGKHTVKVGDLIKIKGRATGVTCAYANTVFGECALEIEAVEMTGL